MVRNFVSKAQKINNFQYFLNANIKTFDFPLIIFPELRSPDRQSIQEYYQPQYQSSAAIARPAINSGV